MVASDFADFYRSSFTPVLRACRAFSGNEEVAYEATQEAFARAFARWPRLAGYASPRGWVTTVAMNLCRRHHRRRQNQAFIEAPVPGPTSDRIELLAALRQLPERQRRAVVLHYLLDCPVTVVADLMNLSEGAVKSHLSRARSTLRNSMEVGHV